MPTKFALGVHFKNYLDHVYAVSNDNGNITEHYRYNAFGEVEIYDNSGDRLATSGIDNKVNWNSRRYDSDTGLHYYKYRHYKSDLGRWLGRDPIEEMGGVNPYAFVANEPIGNLDRLGLVSLQYYAMTAIMSSHSGGPTNYVPAWAIGIKTTHEFAVDSSTGVVSGEKKFTGTTLGVKGRSNFYKDVKVSKSPDGKFEVVQVTMRLSAANALNRLLGDINYHIKLVTVVCVCTDQILHETMDARADGFPTYRAFFSKTSFHAAETKASTLIGYADDVHKTDFYVNPNQNCPAP